MDHGDERNVTRRAGSMDGLASYRLSCDRSCGPESRNVGTNRRRLLVPRHPRQTHCGRRSIRSGRNSLRSGIAPAVGNYFPEFSGRTSEIRWIDTSAAAARSTISPGAASGARPVLSRRHFSPNTAGVILCCLTIYIIGTTSGRRSSWVIFHEAVSGQLPDGRRSGPLEPVRIEIN